MTLWLFRDATHPHHQIGEPVGGVDRTGRLGSRRHGGEATGRPGQGSNLGREPIGGEFRLIEADRATRIHQHTSVGTLILVERVRQRNEDARAADCGKFGDGRRPRARHHEMARRHARRQVVEERGHVAATCSLA